MLLEGKKIVITGGVTGIGQATAIVCAKEGASVVTLSRAKATDERAIETMNACKNVGKGTFAHLTVDVSDRDAIFKTMDEAAKILGGIDCIVNSAGIETHGNAAEVEAEELFRVFGININGTIFANQAALKYLKAAGGGTIINFSSVAGIEGVVGMTAYTASKGAIAAYSRELAQEWGGFNIRVHALLPAVATELARRCYDDAADDVKYVYDALGEKVLVGTKKGYARLGDTVEVGNLIAFLASDMATFMTGQTIGVDGGMVLTR